jgi:peroxiredoxin
MQDQEEFEEVRVGQVAPDFEANDLEGRQRSLNLIDGEKRTVLLFYRGGWCPICNKQLASLSEDYQKFRELGANIVAVSSEEVEKGMELLKKIGPPFTLLSDPDFKAIDCYGVREQNRDMLAKMKSYAKPSVFIIDAQGTIRYKYVGKNAGDRPRNEELLQKLKEIS